MTVGLHLPPTDAVADLFVGMMYEGSLWWLGPEGEWHSQVSEPLSRLTTLAAYSEGISAILFGDGGVFPPFDTIARPPGEYQWGVALVDGAGRLLGPVTWSSMILN